MNRIAIDRSHRSLANPTSFRRRGVLLIWVAILGSLFLAFVMLSVDMGYVYLTAHNLQNASDSAALAGAAKVKFNQNQAKTDAKNAALANRAAGAGVRLDDTAGDVLVGNFNRNTGVFTNNGTPFNSVRVTSRRVTGAPGGPVNLFFAPIFGVDTSNVQRTATAMTGGTFGAGMVVLDSTRRSSLGENGTSLLNISNGGIQVNSSDSAAVELKGGADLLGSQLRVVGGVSPGPGSTLPTTVYQNATPVEDPLKNLPAPAKGTDLSPVNFPNNSITTLSPGYYSQGISTTANNVTINLNPGIYVLGDPGLLMNGGTLNGNGVMLYLTTGTNPAKYGTIDLAGNEHINLTPPTSGPYAGVTIYQDRNTPFDAKKGARVIGTSNFVVGGTLYLPSVHLELGGTSNTLANQIIVRTIDVSGTGVLKVNYDGRNPVEINNVFLVN